MIDVGIAGAKALVVLLMVLNLSAILLWVERKGSALIQDRIGANRANILGVMPFNLGFINTLVADPIKLLTKEDMIPAGAEDHAAGDHPKDDHGAERERDDDADVLVQHCEPPRDNP